VLLSSKKSKAGQNSLSHNVMHEILNKLLTIAISDPDDEVREIMLSSLKKNFFIYLNDKANL
jgi:hypothetical protein